MVLRRPPAGFFLHGRHCREARAARRATPQAKPGCATIAGCKPWPLPPGPAEGFDLGGSDESLARLREYFARFGDVYRVFAPSRGVYNYVINHPDDIKRVLLSNHRNYTKGEGMDRVKILLGNGIMTSEGDFWRRQRRMMQPSFHRRVIDQFSALDPRGQREIRRALGRARRRAAKPVNLTDDASELTLEIVLRSIFGNDLERLERQLGANPFEVVAKEQNRDLKFAFRFRSLDQAGRRS